MTIEERARHYHYTHFSPKGAYDAYIAGAKEQQEIDEAKFESVAESYEKGFAQGQEVGEKETIERACVWLCEHIGHYAKCHKGGTGAMIDPTIIRDFRDAMEKYGKIEDRALKYSTSHAMYERPTNGEYDTATYNAYKAGAVEQKSIDIDKACKAYCLRCDSQSFCRTETFFVCPFVKAFRKAMEE